MKRTKPHEPETTTPVAVGPSLLITGGAGYLGQLLVERLTTERKRFGRIVACDIRAPRRPYSTAIEFRALDIRAPEMRTLIRDGGFDVVVHLATVVTAPKGMTREEMRSIDVGGTENVLKGCLDGGVGKIIVTSSGAAYGYHADNAPLLTEECPLRGNDEFPYAQHKRMVEELLARYREAHPQLKQLILRPGTILGRNVKNPITDLFEKPVIVGVKGQASPFVIIWDQDVVEVLTQATLRDVTGTFNLAGDGVLTLKEIASLLGKRYIEIPISWMQQGLRLLQKAGLSQYGPEQLSFLLYRPVLSNERLKRAFRYTPKLTTRQVFELYRGGALKRSA
ncbi:MAG: SDR family oxidoreductase [Myxococcales bacterium]|nr:SDR family oxidoreductase [Myxococcales bacterium]